MMEHLTISLIAVMHGESTAVDEYVTLEAETREELIPLVADWLQDQAKGFREAMPTKKGTGQ